MKKVELNRQDRRILRLLSGGKRFIDLSKMTKLSERQLRYIIKRLKKAGEILDLDDGKRGPYAHTLIPVGDSFGPESKPSPQKGGKGDVVEALVLLHDDACEVLTALMASRRSRTQKRIRELCNDKIKPVLKNVMRFRQEFAHVYLMDYELDGYLRGQLHPGIYFCENLQKSKRQSAFERPGTLRIRHPDSKSEDDWFYPTLAEWEKYFDKLIAATREKKMQYNLRIGC